MYDLAISPLIRRVLVHKTNRGSDTDSSISFLLFFSFLPIKYSLILLLPVFLHKATDTDDIDELASSEACDQFAFCWNRRALVSRRPKILKALRLVTAYALTKLKPSNLKDDY